MPQTFTYPNCTQCCGGGGGGCCPGVTIPATLHATLSGCTGTGILTNTGSGQRWEGDVVLSPGTLHIALYCDTDSTWKIDTSNCSSNSAVGCNATCSPFQITSHIFILTAGCCGSVTNGTVTVTI